tara:strand:- start:667 stop:1077 length:411 start_codon:yes stop_codon:yes gene_type:complete
MNSKTLVLNFLEEEFDNFKTNFSLLMQEKIIQTKAFFTAESLEDIFKEQKTLNNEEVNGSIIGVLKESIKQKSNITLVLEDLSEVSLKPVHSSSILLVFDRLNKHNQISLIENLIKTQTSFEKTVDFCSRFKRKVQ